MAIVGIDRQTGQPLGGRAHLLQSVRDILTTPQGSRRERPDYGSDLPRMVDLPVTPGWKSSVQAEVARALGRWEPRLKLRAVAVEAIVDGSVTLKLSGDYLGASLILEVNT